MGLLHEFRKLKQMALVIYWLPGLEYDKPTNRPLDEPTPRPLSGGKFHLWSNPNVGILAKGNMIITRGPSLAFRRFQQAAGQVSGTVQETDGIQHFVVGTIKNQKFIERTFHQKRT